MKLKLFLYKYDILKMGNVFKKGHGKPELCQDFEKAYNFLSQRKTSFDDYLKELDDINKVECRSLCNQNIAEQAESYVKEILYKIEQQDPRFKSTLLRSGSFYDEVKIGYPDEFDYMAKLELLSDSKPDILEAVPTKLGYVQLVIKDPESIELWKDFLGEDTNSKGEVTGNVLSIIMLSDRFHELVQAAMKSTPNPPQWRRGPCPLRHGPCAELEFLVDGFRKQDPLKISIDLAICITYPKHQSVQFPFYKYLDDKSACTSFLEKMLSANAEVLLVPYTHDSIERLSQAESPSWEYIYRDQMRVSFSMWEQAIFSQFQKDSTEKRLMRVLKILRDAHLRDDGSVEDWEKSNLSEGEFPDEPPSTIVNVQQVTSVKQITPSPCETENSDQLASLQLEDGEVDIHCDKIQQDLLQTYIFKSLFFYAKLHHDDWFSGGKLPEAVLGCLDTLFQIYSTSGSTVPNFFFDGYTGQIPREHNREKILRRLVKLIVHLKLQIALR